MLCSTCNSVLKHVQQGHVFRRKHKRSLGHLPDIVVDCFYIRCKRLGNTMLLNCNRNTFPLIHIFPQKDMILLCKDQQDYKMYKRMYSILHSFHSMFYILQIRNLRQRGKIHHRRDQVSVQDLDPELVLDQDRVSVRDLGRDRLFRHPLH